MTTRHKAAETKVLTDRDRSKLTHRGSTVDYSEAAHAMKRTPLQKLHATHAQGRDELENHYARLEADAKKRSMPE
jgi:hypothetical protein